MTHQMIDINNQTIELEAHVENSSTVVVISHPHSLFGGSFNNKVVTTLFKHYQNLGVSVIRYNFRGVGRSSGYFAEGVGEQQDLMNVLQWFSLNYVDLLGQHNKEVGKQKELQKVVLIGFSFGAYVSAQVAVSLQWQRLNLVLDQVILVAPPVVNFDLSNIEINSLPNTQFFAVLATQDELVPFEQALSWAEQKNIQHVIIADSSHFFHHKLNDLSEALPKLRE